MSLRRRIGAARSVAPQERHQAALELLARHGGRVRLLNLEAHGEQVAQQRKRHLRAFLRGSAGEQAHGLRAQLRPLLELVHQARFADARLAHHGEKARLAVGQHLLEGPLQPLQLFGAAHHLGLHPFNPVQPQGQWPGLGPQHQVGFDTFGLPFDRERRHGLDVEEAVHLPVGIMRDQNAPNGRLAFEAAGEVDGVPESGELAGGPDCAQHDRAGVNARAHLDRQAAGPEIHQRGLHGEGRPHRLARRALARLAGAEQRHHAVSAVLGHQPAVLRNDGVQARPERVHPVAHVLGILLIGLHGEVHHVGEKHGDLPALGQRGGLGGPGRLGGWRNDRRGGCRECGQRSPASRAEARGGRQFAAATGAAQRE